MAEPPRRRSLRRDPSIFPPITPEFAAGIGYVAAHWALVEGWLAAQIRRLLSLENNAGYAVTAELAGLQRINLLTTLITEARDQECLDDWLDLRDALEPLRAERNEVMHSEWQRSGTEHHQVYVRARERVKGGRYGRITEADLHRLSERILAWLDQAAPLGLKLMLKAAPELRETYPTKPPLTPGQGRRALAQAQARPAKQDRRAADRRRIQTPET